MNKNLLFNCIFFLILFSDSLTASDMRKDLFFKNNESYDYSNIKAHPRLLLTRNEEIKLRENLQNNPYLAQVHRRIIVVSDEILKTDLPVYNIEGGRLLNVSREALKRIYYLSYAYRLNKNPLYLKRAEQELLTVCNFKDWNPSHFLDVGEMAMAVAIGYDWLYDYLSKETRNILKEAIINKAFLPSLQSEYNSFLTRTTNWNQVCNAGLTLAALSIFDEAKEESIGIIERSIESLKLAAQEYAPDGNYTEGYQYWFYGTTFHVMMLAALESALGSDKDLHKIDGFMKTAEYLLFMTGPVSQAFNYSDANARQRPNLAMFWFAQKTDNPSLLYWEKLMLDKKEYSKPFGEERLLPALMSFGNTSGYDDVKAPTNNMWIGRGTVPVALFHKNWGKENAQYLGIKGGKATTPHAHMDAGSFVYDSDGIRWAMDFGMENYLMIEKEGIALWNVNQNSERWKIFRLNNKSHNTITINDKNHIVNAVASIIDFYNNDTLCGAKLDMSAVFGEDIKSVFRTVELIKNDLYVKDEIKTNSRPTLVSWRMATNTIPTIEREFIKLERNGKVKYLTVKSKFPVKFKTWSTSAQNGYESKNTNTYIVGFECELPADIQSHIVVKLTSER